MALSFFPRLSGRSVHKRSAGFPNCCLEGPLADLPGVGANLVDHPSVYIDSGYEGSGRAAPALHTIATFHGSGRVERSGASWLRGPHLGGSIFVDLDDVTSGI
jgi:hypothetical protein